MNKKAIGDLGERKAAKFLKKKGYRIIERNKHESHNELDIVVSNSKYIIFVEVKTRTVDKDDNVYYGIAASAVDSGKQERTITAARHFLSSNPKKSKNKMIRFDVVEVYINRSDFKVKDINHIENAFFAK